MLIFNNTSETFAGFGSPRRSVINNRPLRSARRISAAIDGGRPNADPVHTVLTMTFGQFLDHDMGLASASDIIKKVNGNKN